MDALLSYVPFNSFVSQHSALLSWYVGNVGPGQNSPSGPLRCVQKETDLNKLFDTLLTDILLYYKVPGRTPVTFVP